MAFFEKDWFMRQLRMCVDMAASLVLGKEFTPYKIIDDSFLTAADELHIAVTRLLDEGNINDAEDTLFDGIDPEDMSIFHVGLDFYSRLNQMDDPELAAKDFSREEIRSGLTDFCGEYGCSGLFDELRLSWSED